MYESLKHPGTSKMTTLYVRSERDGWGVFGDHGRIAVRASEEGAYRFALDLAKAARPSRLVWHRADGESVVRRFGPDLWPPNPKPLDRYDGAHGSRGHEARFHFEPEDARLDLRWSMKDAMT